MKKGFISGIIGILFLILIGSVSAELCLGSDGYYDDCWKVNGYYNNYGSYYINSNYNSYYNSNYAYGKMDSCKDSRGNSYACYKQYRNNPYNNDDNYEDDYEYGHYYDNYYCRDNRDISVNYRDVYGNYVTEIRPDYTRRYQDDWNLPWHLRTNPNCYDNYDPVYNNPYYPDVYVNYNNQKNNRNTDVIVYLR